ncbi:SDR family oxidoreductase [Kiritimatiella glycovorans]|uniref:Putative oxidoreductase n=1 Tax=Kiritimatiella glycovorans TaxID=1307763 RepID=A0A0G3EL45_9BACT|nr:SDR family oxidoreductase [Kiritimatiella glycovorans]AKJ65485.1 putative oxidoreductase [Kiritimatiella glycovorans]
MKNVLILGATSDIARALARACAGRGCRLMLAARDPARLEDDVKDLRIRSGAEVDAVQFDALDREAHPEWYAALPVAPDTAVCVFGCLGDEDAAENDPAEAHRIVDTNYAGAVSVLDRAAASMKEAGTGAIVGISSVAGDRGRGSNAHYGSAKAGFSAYLSGLRNRLFPAGVRVLTVKPGYVRTRMTAGMDLPDALTADPDDVADAVLKALDGRRDVIYVKWIWRWIMLVIRMIPEPVFKRLRL